MANVTIKQWADKTTPKMETLVRKVALDAFSEVILKTPVDSGRARASWGVGVGTVNAGPTNGADKTGQIAIAAAASAAVGMQVGQVITLASNLPYIERLEYGYSKQAPAGMVRLTAQRWSPIVDKAVAQIART